MAFDLQAATLAAQSEAERAPFEVDWGDDHFAIPNLSTWPLAVQAGFVKMADTETDQIDPAEVLALLRDVIGADYDRFAATVPMSAIPVLVEAMVKAQVGAAMPDFSLPPEPVSTPT